MTTTAGATPALNFRSNNHMKRSGSVPNTTTTKQRRSIRFPEWALSMRFFPAASPDSTAKRTVQSLPSIDDDALVLPPMMEAATTNTSAAVAVQLVVLLQMNVGELSSDDLHLDLDVEMKRLCLAGKSPKMMFKRTFPIQNYEDADLLAIQACIVMEHDGDDEEEQDGTRVLRVLAPRRSATAAATKTPARLDDASRGTRRKIPIQDDTRPPTFIEIRN